MSLTDIANLVEILGILAIVFGIALGLIQLRQNRRLKARGLYLGIATMDREASARALLDSAGAALDFLCGSDSGLAGKPAADMALAFCAAVGVAPGRLAVIGDTPADMAMARAAGAKLAIGVRTGVAGIQVLDHCADFVIDSVANLDGALNARGLVAARHFV